MKLLDKIFSHARTASSDLRFDIHQSIRKCREATELILEYESHADSQEYTTAIATRRKIALEELGNVVKLIRKSQNKAEFERVLVSIAKNLDSVDPKIKNSELIADIINQLNQLSELTRNLSIPQEA